MTAPPNITLSTVYNGLFGGSWAGGAGLVLTYSVPGPGTSYWAGYSSVTEYNEPYDGFSVLSNTQKARFVQIMEQFDSLVGATFNGVPDNNTNPGDIRVAFHNPDAEEWGYAYLPFANTNPAFEPGLSGDIWISNQVDGILSSTFAVGSYDYFALMHEVGHALGLKHTFESPVIPLQYDNYRYSIMSYTSQTDMWHVVFDENFANSERVVPITPMLFDVHALQQLYGAGSAGAGATTYSFDPSFAVLQTIWDAGGIDTWNLAGHSRPSFVDLRPGAFSSVDFYSRAAQIDAAVLIWGEFNRAHITNNILNGSDLFTWTDNVAIAYGTIIENVTFGNSNDTAIGNDANNVLLGNGGADNLKGGGGNDRLDGGTGTDTLTGNAGDDTFVVDIAGDVVIEAAAQGTDKVLSSVTYTLTANVENLVLLDGFGALSGTGNTLNNTILGNGASNVLTGGAGNDTLDGDAGFGINQDTMVGGIGDDKYYVNFAGDVVTENASEGGDTVIATLDYTLVANVEHLALGGTGNFAGTGNVLNNRLTGNGGGNTLKGMDGNDVIDGGAGNDIIYGNRGADSLKGGTGSDTFVFNSTLAAANRDTIVDFNVAADTIWLENGAFTALGAAGALSADAFQVGGVAADADVRIIYNPSNGKLFYDADGDGASAVIWFATLQAGLSLTASDFVIV